MSLTDEELEQSRAAGVMWYDDPRKLRPEQIDELIRPVVLRINESGWVWTAESCQGHPDATSHVWAGNVQPMLRLVTRVENSGRLFAELMAAALEKSLDDGTPNGGLYGNRYQAFEIFPHKVAEPWFEVLIYARVSFVLERTLALACFQRFADRACDDSRQNQALIYGLIRDALAVGEFPPEAFKVTAEELAKLDSERVARLQALVKKLR